MKVVCFELLILRGPEEYPTFVVVKMNGHDFGSTASLGLLCAPSLLCILLGTETREESILKISWLYHVVVLCLIGSWTTTTKAHYH